LLPRVQPGDAIASILTIPLIAEGLWMFPWLDRSGRLSALKLIVFLALFGPGIWIAAQWQMGWLIPKPVTEAIHQTGDWTVRFLLLSLLVTPLRRTANWGKLILVRRMIGVAALAYGVIHLSLYCLDQHFDLAHVASEILLRIYLTIGFSALLGLSILGLTSTDAMIQRLGAKRWQRLHQCVYAIALVALTHFLLQSKIDVTQAVLMIGFFMLLMGYRLVIKAGFQLRVGELAIVAVFAAALTAGGEALWYGLATGISGMRVLAANLDFDLVIRPAWWVLASGLALAGTAWLRQPKRARVAARTANWKPASASQPS
jgi:methionine sulfoxide reductase heme-binding subunit